LQGSTVKEIYQSLRTAIESGALAEGEALPTTRALADRLGVNRNTVAAAYQQLVRSGLATADGRRGTRVAPRRADGMPGIAATGARDLASGNPDPLLLPDLRTVWPAIAVPPPTTYGEPVVWPPLAAWARNAFGRDGLTGDMLVTNGAVDAMALCLQARLKPGDAVALEEPCFLSALRLVRLLGLRPVPVAIDDEGIMPAALADALRQRPKALIVTPRAHSPTGTCLSPARAEALGPLIAGAKDLTVIEDDHFSLLSAAPAVSLTPAARRWVVIRSLAKFLGPDLRLACVLADAATAATMADRQAAISRWSSRWLQAAAATALARMEMAAEIATARQAYAERRQALLAALADHGIAATGTDGINIWIPLPHDEAMAAALGRCGWAVMSGAAFRIADAGGIRVTIADLTTEEALLFARDLARLQAGGYPHPV
jgi:DNA-binding transcriptional MocR family regulator